MQALPYCPLHVTYMKLTRPADSCDVDLPPSMIPRFPDYYCVGLHDVSPQKPVPRMVMTYHSCVLRDYELVISQQPTSAGFHLGVFWIHFRISVRGHR